MLHWFYTRVTVVTVVLSELRFRHNYVWGFFLLFSVLPTNKQQQRKSSKQNWSRTCTSQSASMLRCFVPEFIFFFFFGTNNFIQWFNDKFIKTCFWSNHLNEWFYEYWDIMFWQYCTPLQFHLYVFIQSAYAPVMVNVFVQFIL